MSDQDAIPQRPPWLDEEPEALSLLHKLLDLLDQKPTEQRARMPSVTLTATTAPELFRHNDASATTWTLLKSLHGSVYDIALKRRRQPFEPDYACARISLGPQGEKSCRAWLGRPRPVRYQDEWVRAVEACAPAFADGGQSLRTSSIRIPGKNPLEVINALSQLTSLGDTPVTLRQLSARLFWGHSKVLDSREELIRTLAPSLTIAPRPVLVHAYLPKVTNGVLFIENQDSYLQAIDGRPNEAINLTLVYVSGFRASTERIRTLEGVSIHYHHASTTDASERHHFEQWWLRNQNTSQPLWFWGDLDYAGLTILKTLRQRFGDVLAWPPGYEPMEHILQTSGGHLPEEANKGEQHDPGATGCGYVDSVLLPLIREKGRFVDQELV